MSFTTYIIYTTSNTLSHTHGMVYVSLGAHMAPNSWLGPNSVAGDSIRSIVTNKPIASLHQFSHFIKCGVCSPELQDTLGTHMV